uniref:Sulfotransferase domain-containing protein n=1 Tax=Octactis speculum TaxID=3111310 RepID=A0A7S2H006_9STRA
MKNAIPSGPFTDQDADASATTKVSRQQGSAGSCMFYGLPDSSEACLELQRQVPANCTRYINTRKYDPQCHSTRPPKKVYKLLVTGAGGSGTNLIATALKRVGVVVGHEYITKRGSASWTHAVNDAIVGAKYPFPRKGPYESRSILEENSIRFKHVIHQVRCPAANIAALTSHNNFSRAFLSRAAGIDPNLPDCVWGAWVWLRWNLHIGSYADSRYRIEDFTAPEDMAAYLCDLVGLKCHRKDLLAASVASRVAKFLGLTKLGLHHREHGACTIADVSREDPELGRKVEALSKYYGYESAECERV